MCIRDRTYTVQSDLGSTYTRGIRLLRPARQQPTRVVKARFVIAHLISSSPTSNSITNISKPSKMPKALFKTKGVPAAANQQDTRQILVSPVADRALDLTLHQVSGDGGASHSSIVPCSTNFNINRTQFTDHSVSTIINQSTVIGQQGVVDTLSYPTLRPGVLPAGRHIHSTGTHLRLVEQYGQFQFQRAGEIYGGRTPYQTNEGQPYDKYPRGTSSLLHDRQHHGHSSGRFPFRAVNVHRLQNLSELQSQNQRLQSQEEDCKTEGGPFGNEMAQGPGRDTQNMQQHSHNATAALQAYRPPKRNNLKRVADCNSSNVAHPQKRQRTRAYICLLYTSPSPRDLSTSRMPSSA